MVLRSVLCAVAVATALSLVAVPAPVEAAPVEAAKDGGPLAGLEVHPEWGKVTGRSGVLKGGCRTYTFSYSIVPPEGIWALEVFISGPGFKHVAAGAFLDGYDPKSGSGHYKLCRATTRYGTFKIQAKVSVDDGAGHIVDGRLPGDTFRLHAPH